MRSVFMFAPKLLGPGLSTLHPQGSADRAYRLCHSANAQLIPCAGPSRLQEGFPWRPPPTAPFDWPLGRDVVGALGGGEETVTRTLLPAISASLLGFQLHSRRGTGGGVEVAGPICCLLWGGGPHQNREKAAPLLWTLSPVLG